jgi:hypothetical protein
MACCIQGEDGITTLWEVKGIKTHRYGIGLEVGGKYEGANSANDTSHTKLLYSIVAGHSVAYAVWDVTKGGGFGRHRDMELEFWEKVQEVMQELISRHEQQQQQQQQQQRLLENLYVNRYKVSAVVEGHRRSAKQAVDE